MEASAVKVMLIDDELEILDMSRKFLELDLGIAVDTATSAVHALRMIKLQEYDVIVSDFQMPGRDGIELLKDIRATGNQIPFILFTGKGREEVAIEALNCGANFYLQKGGDPTSQFAELVNMIKQSHSRKEGEQTLRISEERYRSLFENSIDGVMLATVDGSILSANPSACHMFDMTEDEIKKIGREEIVVKDEKWEIAYQGLNQTGIANGEFTFRRKDGTTFIGEATSGLFNGLDGNAKISMIIRDITENNKNKEELKASELRYRRLFETAQDGILIIDYESERIIDANKFILDLTGYSLDAIIGKSLWELGFIEDKLLAEKAFSELRTNGYVRYENIPLRRKDDRTMQVEFVSNAYMVEGTKIIQCNIRDISERESRGQRIEELVRIIDSAYDAVIGEDLDGIVASWNKGAEGIYEYARNDIVGRSISLLAAPDSQDDLQEILMRVSRGESISHYETTHLTKSGKQIEVSLTVSPVLDSHGRAVGTSTIARDISERKRIEEALAQASMKLKLLSSITRHDINNQMMLLMGHLALMEKKQTDASSNEHLPQIEAAAKRISTIIKFTKAYEDIGVKAPVWQDVQKLVGTCAGDDPHGHVKVVNDIPAGIEVFADPLILKVFDNLIDNAVRHGGTVTTIRFSIEEHDGVRAIVCEDDGVGISADMKEKLFTRDLGKDHGLGLFLSREILSITGSTIAENGEHGKGARFEIRVPSGKHRMMKSVSSE